jgi:hypothetical protein
MEELMGVVGIGIFVLVVFIMYKKKQKIKALKDAYAQALRGTDKQAALAAGRVYYSALRKDNILTIYDETAITNDISAMNV